MSFQETGQVYDEDGFASIREQTPRERESERYRDLRRFQMMGDVDSAEIQNTSASARRSSRRSSSMRNESPERQEEETEEEMEGCSNFACKKNGGYCLIFIVFIVISSLSLLLFLLSPLGAWVMILLIVGGAIITGLFGWLIYTFCKTGRMMAALFTAILVYLALLGMILFSIFYPV